MNTADLPTILHEAIIKEVQRLFEEIAMNEIDKQEAALIERIKNKVEVCRVDARKTAQKMAIDLLYMPDVSGMKIEFRI